MMLTELEATAVTVSLVVDEGGGITPVQPGTPHLHRHHRLCPPPEPRAVYPQQPPEVRNITARRSQPSPAPACDVNT
ncbi:hypothetical protein [Nocardia sp. CA-135398]|uniref:hypothetical protein n=1 Tax=Nocardia sp. CA-135398 TaxID=3239977 RepID=UPI003D97F233